VAVRDLGSIIYFDANDGCLSYHNTRKSVVALFFFGTVTEILVLPEYQRKGIRKQLMTLVFDTSPTSLFLSILSWI